MAKIIHLKGGGLRNTYAACNVVRGYRTEDHNKVSCKACIDVLRPFYATVSTPAPKLFFKT